jgi:hypothetical protein
MNDRAREQIQELNQSIEVLAAALASEDWPAAAKACRAVEVDAFALRLMLRGGSD